MQTLPLNRAIPLTPPWGGAQVDPSTVKDVNPRPPGTGVNDRVQITAHLCITNDPKWINNIAPIFTLTLVLPSEFVISNQHENKLKSVAQF